MFIGGTKINWLFRCKYHCRETSHQPRPKMIQNNLISQQQTGLLGPKVPINDSEEVVSQLPRPDFSQMIPFKPKSAPFPYEHPLAGGTFPQPPALAALCSQLPPPVCYRGPFVSVDALIDVFNHIQLPDCKYHNVKWMHSPFLFFQIFNHFLS